jgi:hypothetical protein
VFESEEPVDEASEAEAEQPGYGVNGTEEPSPLPDGELPEERSRARQLFSGAVEGVGGSCS